MVPTTVSYEITEAPGKPVGPLEAIDIQRTSITIRWKPPLYDGGSPLTGYIVERREAKRTLWSKVTTVKPDITTYQARIYLLCLFGTFSRLFISLSGMILYFLHIPSHVVLFSCLHRSRIWPKAMSMSSVCLL